MEITANRTEKALVIKVSGRLDTTTAQDFESKCLELVADSLGKTIIDLQGVEYISSAGLRSILSVGKKIKSDGGHLAFCRLGGMVREVFEISGFSSIFSIYDSQEQAIDSI